MKIRKNTILLTEKEKEAFSERHKELRADLSRKQLENKYNGVKRKYNLEGSVSAANIDKIEHCQRNAVKITTIDLIIKTFDCSIDWLLGHSDDKNDKEQWERESRQFYDLMNEHDRDYHLFEQLAARCGVDGFMDRFVVLDDDSWDLSEIAEYVAYRKDGSLKYTNKLDIVEDLMKELFHHFELLLSYYSVTTPPGFFVDGVPDPGAQLTNEEKANQKTTVYPSWLFKTDSTDDETLPF